MSSVTCKHGISPWWTCAVCEAAEEYETATAAEPHNRTTDKGCPQCGQPHTEQPCISPQHILAHAVDLLRQTADVIRESHTEPFEYVEWGDEHAAKADHDQHIGAAYALESLRAIDFTALRSATVAIEPICLECEEPRECHNNDYCYRHTKPLSASRSAITPLQVCEHGQGITDYCQPCGRINGGG